MTPQTIFYGLLLVVCLIIVLATVMIWIDGFYEDADEHSDTDNSRG